MDIAQVDSTLSRKGQVYVMGKNFTPGEKLDSANPCAAASKGNLQLHTIHLTDIEKRKQAPSFNKNGFELIKDIPRSVVDAIRHYNLFGSEEYLQDVIEEHMSSYIGKWASGAYNREQASAIMVDLVHRDTHPNTDKIYHVITMAHVDFPSDVRQVQRPFCNIWKPAIEKKVGKIITMQEYFSLPILGIVTAWIPLDDIVRGSHLAIMDKASLQQDELVEYATVRKNGIEFFPRIYSPHLSEKSQETWNISNMCMGNAYLIDACNTPHAALQVDNNIRRRSIESRYIVLSM